MSFLHLPFLSKSHKGKMTVIVTLTITIFILITHLVIRCQLVQKMQPLPMPVRSVKSYPFLFGAESLPCSVGHLYNVSAVLNIAGATLLLINDGDKILTIGPRTNTIDGFPVMSVSDEGMVIHRFGTLQKICISTPASLH